jgi:hypothetical protein
VASMDFAHDTYWKSSSPKYMPSSLTWPPCACMGTLGCWWCDKGMTSETMIVFTAEDCEQSNSGPSYVS